MQGNRNYQVEALIERDGAEEVGSKRLTQRFDTGVFEQMDEIFQGSFVISIGVGGIVAGEAGAAAAADAMVI